MVFATNQHELDMDMKVSLPLLSPPPMSLPTPYLCVVPENLLWVPCFMHQTCTGHQFYLW